MALLPTTWAPRLKLWYVDIFPCTTINYSRLIRSRIITKDLSRVATVLMLSRLLTLLTLVVIEEKTWAFRQHLRPSTNDATTTQVQFFHVQLLVHRVRSWTSIRFQQHNLPPSHSLHHNTNINTVSRPLCSRLLHLHKELRLLQFSRRMAHPLSASQVSLRKSAPTRHPARRWASFQSPEWREDQLCSLRNVLLSNHRLL